MLTGTPRTRLVVLRGNSGSGKSTVARALRDRYGRGAALVEQDYLRRIVLKERDRPGAANIELIDQTVRFALDHDYHVVLEGILYAAHYGDMLRRLVADHAGETFVYYFDVPFDETVRRHATRPQSSDFTVEQMRDWFVHDDQLGVCGETVIAAESGVDATVDAVYVAAFAGDAACGRADAAVTSAHL